MSPLLRGVHSKPISKARPLEEERTPRNRRASDDTPPLMEGRPWREPVAVAKGSAFADKAKGHHADGHSVAPSHGEPESGGCAKWTHPISRAEGDSDAAVVPPEAPSLMEKKKRKARGPADQYLFLAFWLCFSGLPDLIGSKLCTIAYQHDDCQDAHVHQQYIANCTQGHRFDKQAGCWQSCRSTCGRSARATPR